MIHVAGIIRRHLDNILNYLNHRITDAVTEGLNAKSQWINTPRVTSATESGSRPPSIFIAADWTSTHDNENPLIPSTHHKPGRPSASMFQYGKAALTDAGTLPTMGLALKTYRRAAATPRKRSV